MEKLVTVNEVSERNGCSLPTARKYIRQCNPYMERPLTTTQRAFHEWEASRMYGHFDMKRASKALLNGLRDEKFIIPRRTDK